MANSLGSRGVFLSGEKAITTSGTAEALASSVDLYASIVIIAKTGNTNQVYVGGSDVSTSTNDGLDAGDALEIKPARAHGLDLAQIYLDVDTNGEGVDFYAVR
jgi:hypothetical protein